LRFRNARERAARRASGRSAGDDGAMASHGV
jgi:hypothetical protein